MEFGEFNEGVGTYVGIRVDDKSTKFIVDLQKTLRLKNPLSSDKFHSTVLFSRKQIDVPSTGNNYDAVAYKLDNFETSDGKNAVVLVIKSDSLSKRHQELIDVGGTHDFPQYTPHITLSYNDEPVNLELTQDINLIGEYSESLDLDWKNK